MISPPDEDLISACGITWNHYDIARFLLYCRVDPSTNCLIWIGGKSRGRGKTDWYGSFWISSKPGIKGRTIRAHVFYAVAVLGHRPRAKIHQLDHTCNNSLCVRHIACVPESVNRALQWIRVQVGIESPPDYYAAVVSKLEEWVGSNRSHILDEWEFIPDVFDPRYWPVDPQLSSDHILTHVPACV